MVRPPEQPPVSEALVQYAWRTQRFAVDALRTTDGRAVRVRNPGRLNTDAGPDFRDATVELGGVVLQGDVEIHLQSDDWYRHGHQADPAYNRVVLHMVLQAGSTPIQRADTRLVPEAVLGGLLPPDELARLALMQDARGNIPCAPLLPQAGRFPVRRWLHSLGLARLVRKAEAMSEVWEAGGRDWTQAFWRELCGAFAGPQNKAAFQLLADRLPLRILHKHADAPLLLEALLFGVAGLLESPADDYSAQLQQHWQHLSAKYGLQPLPPGTFAFLRMRPANFPTVRLAQLAAIVAAEQAAGTHLLDLLDAPPKIVAARLAVPASAYWDTHYRFGAPTKAAVKRAGAELTDRIVINLVVPFGMLYYQRRQEPDAAAAVAERLTQLRPERNHVVDEFAAAGLRPRHALESQALLDQQSQYCAARRCLECGIGHELLKP